MKHDVPPPRPEYIQFLSLFGPGITQLALAVRQLVLEEAPASTELIYDAYNAVATGYSFTGRPIPAVPAMPSFISPCMLIGSIWDSIGEWTSRTRRGCSKAAAGGSVTSESRNRPIWRNPLCGGW
jgi:hypothetical protein